MKKKKVWNVLVCAGLMCSMLFSGCGSSSTVEDTDGESTAKSANDVGISSETTSDENTDDLTKLSIQLSWLPQGEFMGYYVAQSKGYYKDEGIDLEIIPGGSDISPEDQVENGVCELGNAFYTSLLTYREGGYDDLIDVAQIYQDSALRLIAKKDTGIETGADLKGKRVGNWFGGQQYELYALCGKYGYDVDNDVEWVQQDFTMDAFYNDELDAASVMIYNEYNLVLESGMTEDEFNVIDMNEEGIALLEDCLICRKDWAEENKDLLVRFLRATIKGWKYACENPEEAGQICWEAGQSVSLEHQISMCQAVVGCVAPDGTDMNQLGKFDEDKFEQTIKLGLENNLIQEDVDYKDTIDSSYWEEAVSE